MRSNAKQPEQMKNLFDARSSSAWPKQPQKVADMKQRYGDARQFLEIFTPTLQTYAAKEWVRAYTGVAPSLETVAQGYGTDTAIVWLCMELEDVNLFVSVKEKLSVGRQKELSKLILAEYPFLKVSEILLFFHRLKCGRYGRFYGSVDALFITSALALFVQERKQDLIRIHEAIKKRQEASRPVSRGITYEEYVRLKQLKQQQQDEEENKL